MKRLVLALLGASLLAFASCGGGDTGIIENADGSIIYTRPDKDGSAVKYNQKHDGFTNVTIINGKAVKTLNPINQRSYMCLIIHIISHLICNWSILRH